MRRAILFTALALAAAPAGAQEGAAAPDVAERLALNPLSSLDKSSLDGFRDAPLFTPSRTRPSPPPPPVAEAAPPPPEPEPVEQAPAEPPTLKLSGIVQGPDGAVAFVAKQGEDQVEQLRLGDQVDGWLVSTIDPQALKLTLDDREQEYRLFLPPENADAPDSAASDDDESDGDNADSSDSSDEESSSDDDESEDAQTKVQRESEAARKARRDAARGHAQKPESSSQAD